MKNKKNKKEIIRQQEFEKFRSKMLVEQIEHFTKQGLGISYEFLQRFEKNIVDLYNALQEERKMKQDEFRGKRVLTDKEKLEKRKRQIRNKNLKSLQSNNQAA